MRSSAGESWHRVLPTGLPLGWVATLLMQRRGEVLGYWLDAALREPFHDRGWERAVTPHLPALFDAVTAALQRSTLPAAGSPLDAGWAQDDAVQRAAREHALARVRLCFDAAAVAAELRLLRNAILSTLRHHLTGTLPSDVLAAAELRIYGLLEYAILEAIAAVNEALERARRQFLQAAVHELRQHLATVKGNVQVATRLLSEAGAAPDDVEQTGERLRRADLGTTQMAMLLAVLAGAPPLPLRPLRSDHTMVDLYEVLSSVAQRLRQEGHRQIIVDAPPQEAILGRWERRIVEYIIETLLTLAAHHAPSAAPIETSVESMAGTVRLRIVAREWAIPASDLRHLLETRDWSKVAIEGILDTVGFGLYLARAMIEALGGAISVQETSHGRGVGIELTLPA